MGIELDDGANKRAVRGESGIISRGAGRSAVLVVTTNEEWMIARDTAELAKLGDPSARAAAE